MSLPRYLGPGDRHYDELRLRLTVAHHTRDYRQLAAQTCGTVSYSTIQRIVEGRSIEPKTYRALVQWFPATVESERAKLSMGDAIAQLRENALAIHGPLTVAEVRKVLGDMPHINRARLAIRQARAA